MKISLLFLFVFTFKLTAFNVGNAQNAVIEIKADRITIGQLIDEIEAQTGYLVVYSNREIDTNREVNIQQQEDKVSSYLNSAFSNTDIGYNFEDEYIVLSKKAHQSTDIDATPTQTVQQQGKVITGRIIDTNGEPIIGANILEVGTVNGTITDIDGNFSLSIGRNAVLHISYIGYLEQDVQTSDETTLNITLIEDSRALDEIVVVGFARQKKANLTGAVSGVTMDELLKDRPVTNTSTLLQGAIPGLQITSDTGEPGGGFTFNIRGTTSLQGGSPLILVDNIPMTGPLNLINPNDIESISVLKDGGAAAIYGARGAFGVVLITTKGAALDQKTKVNYNGNLAFTRAGELPVKSSPLETVQAFKDFGYQGGTTWRGRDTDKWIDLLKEYNANPSAYPNGYTEVDGLLYQLQEYDQMRDFIGHTGFQQVHNLSVNGGSAKTSYRISLGFVDSDGALVTDKDSYRKYNVRSFLNTELSSWLTGQMDISYYQSKKTMPNKGGWSDAVTIPTFVPTGTWNVGGEDIILGTPANMVRMSSLNKDMYADTRMTGRLIAKPTPNFTLTGEFTYDRLANEVVNYNKKMASLSYYDYDLTIDPINSVYNNTKQATDNMVFNLFGGYDKTFGEHNLGLLGGFNAESYHSDYLNAIVYNMINDELPSIDQSVGEKKPADSFSEYSLLGFFGRLNYSFKDRYLLEVNSRYDGSSKFPQGHRWGFFPSISGGWRISEEPFMEPIKHIIPGLKVRGSYATLGNQSIVPYSFLATMDASYDWVNAGSQTLTLGTPGLVRTNFTWETIETTNVGVDIDLLQGRFNAVLDFYSRKTKDMLDNAADFPSVAGASAPMMNVADLESKGWEIDVRWKDRIGKVQYNIGFNLYDYKAKITNLPSNDTFSLASNYTGLEMGSIWGYVTDRFYTEADFDSDGNLLEGIPYPKGITKPSPGDVLFVDFDDSGIIDNGDNTLENPGDMKIIGNNSLRLQYGINGGISWNNFDFSFYLQGIGERDLWMSNELTFPSYFEWGTMFTHLTDYWTPENTDAFYPKGYSNGTKNSVYNSNIRTQTK